MMAMRMCQTTQQRNIEGPQLMRLVGDFRFFSLGHLFTENRIEIKT